MALKDSRVTYLLFSNNASLISRVTLSLALKDWRDVTYLLFSNNTPLISRVALSMALKDRRDVRSIFKEHAVD